jgi:F-type H+-transporting ATPase subunit epsilon
MINAIHLKILLPSRVFADIKNVREIVAESCSGVFAILPNRIDGIAALPPSLLSYTTNADVRSQTFVIIDSGILTKVKEDVVISVRNAFAPDEAGRSAAEKQQKTLLKQATPKLGETSEIARLEAQFFQLLMEMLHEKN